MYSNQLQVQSSETPIWLYWDEFLETYLQKGRSEVTIRNVCDALKFVERHLGLYFIEDCNNPRLLDDALSKSQKARKFSKTTFNTYLKNLNTYYIWLESREYIDENKIRKVMRAKEEQNEQLTLNEEQVQKIIERIHTRRQTRLERHRNTLFIDLLRYTGARPCELLDMKIKDIIKEQNGYKLVIRGRKQKGKPRYYPLPSYIRDVFETYIDYRNRLKRIEPNLFVSSSKSTGWTVKGMRGLFKRLSKEVGFSVTAYSFRRYVATNLNAKALPISDIMNYLGHTRATTTLRYIQRSTILTTPGANIMEKAL